MSYEYQTVRQRRIRIQGTCQRTQTFYFWRGGAIPIRSATGLVYFGLKGSGPSNSNPRSLFLGVQVTTTSSGGNNPTWTVTVRDSTLGGLAAGVVVDTFTMTEADGFYRTYAKTDAFEIFCDVEEITAIGTQQTEFFRYQERQRVGGKRGVTVNGNTWEQTITSGNLGVTEFFLTEADFDFNVVTYSYREATSQPNTSPPIINNFGQGPVTVAGGTVAGSISVQWEGGGASFDMVPVSGSQTRHHDFTVGPLQSGGQAVNVRQQFDTTLTATGGGLSLTGCPIPPDYPRDNANTQTDGSLGTNTASGTMTGRVSAYRLFNVTAKLVGPDGQPVSDVPLQIQTNPGVGSLPALSGVGQVTYQTRAGRGGANSFIHNGEANGTSVTEFSDDAAVKRTIIPNLDTSFAHSFDDSRSFLLHGKRWQRLSIGPLAAVRYLFGGPLKPAVPLSSGFGTAGWQKSQYNTLSYGDGNALRITNGSAATATEGVYINQYTYDLDYRFIRVKVRSIGGANYPMKLSLVDATTAGIDTFELTTGSDGEWKEVLLDRLAPYKAIAAIRGKTYVDTEALAPPPTPGPTTGEAPLAENDAGVFRIVAGGANRVFEVAWARFERLQEGVLESDFARQWAGADGKRSVIRDTSSNFYQPPPSFADALGWPRVVVDTARTDKPAGSSTAYRPISDLYDSEFEDTSGIGTQFVPFLPTSASFVAMPVRVAPVFTSQIIIGQQTLHNTQIRIDYPGVGDLFQIDTSSPGAYSKTTNLVWEYQIGWQFRGAVIGGDATVQVAELPSPGRAAGQGVPVGGGYYASQSPFPYKPSVSHEAYLVGKGSSYKGKLWGYRRYWWLVEEAGGGALCVDSARQWIHIARDKKIVTYHVRSLVAGSTPAPAFQSAEYEVSAWKRLTFLARHATLYMLADKGGSSYGVFASRDGGKSAQERLTVTARTATIAADSERAVLVTLFENEGNIQRRVSRNGGASWEAASAVLFGGATKTGKILSVDEDGRAGGAIFLMADVGSGAQVWLSRDLGANWNLVLS